MKKKYQIFISSTYKDLVEARGKVIEAILSLKHIPIGMENFTASNRNQWQYIKDVLKDCDYYVLIVGHRYGSIDSDTGISYTEMEFDFAKSLNIPILSFVIDRNSMPLLPDDRESHEHEEKLKGFISQKVRKGTLNSKDWTSPDHLASLVTASLVSEMEENPRTGWIRSDKIDELYFEIERLQEINQRLALQSRENPMDARQPNIEVVFNNTNTPNFKLEKVHYNKETFKILNYDKLVRYHKYLTREEIEHYNSSIPAEKEIEEYNEALEMYTRIQHLRLGLGIKIRNSGKLKADSIYVDIKFPKEVIVIENGEVDEWKQPSRPNHFPLNPLKRAQKKLEEESEKETQKVLGLRGYDKVFPMSLIDPPMPALMNPSKIARLTNSNSNSYLRVQNNEITIRLNSLIHSREINFKEDVEIIVLKAGNFNIVANVICEQYPQPKEINIPIKITE